MTKRLVLIGAIALIALSQSPSPRTVIGTVKKVNGGEIIVATGAARVTIYADRRAEITVKRTLMTYHDLSSIKAGVEVAGICEPDPSGKLIVRQIWIEPRIATLRGTVTRMGENQPAHGGFELRTRDRGQTSLVSFARHTVFGAASAGLTEGQDVEVVGVDLGDGKVNALRIAILNSDTPLDP